MGSEPLFSGSGSGTPSRILDNVRVDGSLQVREREQLVLAGLEAVLLSVSIHRVIVEVVHIDNGVMLRSRILCIEEAVQQGRHIGTGLFHTLEVSPTEAIGEAAAFGPELELFLTLDIFESKGGHGSFATGTYLNVIQGLETAAISVTYTGAALRIHKEDFSIAEENIVCFAI